MQHMKPPSIPERPVAVVKTEDLKALLDTCDGSTLEGRRYGPANHDPGRRRYPDGWDGSPPPHPGTGYEIGVNESFSDGTHSRLNDVTVNLSLSN